MGGSTTLTSNLLKDIIMGELFSAVMTALLPWRVVMHRPTQDNTMEPLVVGGVGGSDDAKKDERYCATRAN